MNILYDFTLQGNYKISKNKEITLEVGGEKKKANLLITSMSDFSNKWKPDESNDIFKVQPRVVYIAWLSYQNESRKKANIFS